MSVDINIHVPGNRQEDLVGADHHAAHMRHDHRHHLEYPELHAQHHTTKHTIKKRTFKV